MKDRKVQRGITSRHARSGGDAPDIGKVSRVHGQDPIRNSSEPRRHGSRQNAARRKAIKLWSIALGIAALMVMAAAFFLWLLPMLTHGSGASKSTGNFKDADARIISKFPSPGKDEAIQLVKDALANRDLDRIEQLFRTGSSSAREILDFCKSAAERDGVLGDLDWLSSLDSDGLLIEGVVVNYQGKEKLVQRLALLTPDKFGNWRLDFDAFARIAEPPIPDLLERKADVGIFRAMVAPDVYYNGPFADESEWVSYAINSPDLDKFLHGYCKKGTAQAEEMAKLFSDEIKVSRATLELRSVKGSETRQFEITRLLAHDWILPEPAEDKR